MKKIAIIVLLSIIIPAAYAQHFQKVWTGNGFSHHNFYVYSASIEGTGLQAGDEIAVFDGGFCVGAIVLQGVIDPRVDFVASMNDVGNDPVIDGYTTGNQIVFKIWDSVNKVEYSSETGTLRVVHREGVSTTTFASGGTTQVDLFVDTPLDILFDSNEGHWINTTASLVGGYPDVNWAYRSIDWTSTNKYWMVQFSTEGYAGLSFTAEIRRQYETGIGARRGPQYFTTEYSINGGGGWEPLENPFVTNGLHYWDIGDNNNWLTMSFNLPPECQNQKQVLFRWKLAATEGISNNGFSEIRNVKVTGTGQAIRDMRNIPANDSAPVVFNKTGITLAFSGDNPYQTITSVLKKHRPAGTYAGYPHIAPQYWTITSSAAIPGTYPGTYDITIDITEVPGVEDARLLVLLKREDANSEWVSKDVPDAVEPNEQFGPLLTWIGIDDGFSDFTLGGSGVNTLPVELSSFTAAVTANMFVQLKWTAETETYMLGYNVYRSETNNISDAVKANFVIIPAHNSSYARDYTYYDEDVEGGMMYYYWLQSNDLDLTNQFHGPVSVFVEAQHDNDSLIKPEIVTELIGAYPNPFNPSTHIAFSVAGDSKVSIKVYNIAGMHIKTIVNNDSFTKGKHSVHWDGTDSYGNSAASGVYFYKMETDIEEAMIKKMLLLK